MKKKKIVFIILVIALIICVIGSAIYMFSGHYVHIKGQHLKSYSYSSGGGMTGGYYDQTVKKYDDKHALVTIKKADWYAQDPQISLYLVDNKILDDLEQIVLKYKMNFWNGKTFSRVFIHDGENESYSFSFDEDVISFSSQVYPRRYYKKLSNLNEVFNLYLDDSYKLPGLVINRAHQEDEYYLPEDEIELYVYYYTYDSIGIRILNGKDEKLTILPSYQLINADTKEVLIQENSTYENVINPSTRDEIELSTNLELKAGHYIIFIDDYELPFEIK